MKDSGIEWIGKIPEGWRTSRVGLHYDIVLGKMLCSEQATPQHTLGRYYCAANVHFGEISPEDELKEMWFSEAEKQSYGIKEGDLLVVEGGAGAGGCAIASRIQGEVYIQNSILRVRAKEGNDNRYLRYYIESMVKRNYIDIVCNKATIPHFTKDKLGAMPYIVMSLAEQQAIADYLDEKCAAIDKLIDNQKVQIEKMKEYKQSVITEAVTKGLNPSVPMKDSGIAWIGKIPEGWEMDRLKYVATYNDEVLPENLDGNTEIKYIDIGSVSLENGIEHIEEFSFRDAPSRARRVTNSGDIIVSTVRTYLKAIAKIKQNGLIVSTGFCVIRPIKSVCGSYIEYYCKSNAFTDNVSSNSYGISYPAINSSVLMGFYIPSPPLAEQQAIADYLDEKCAAIDKLIAVKQAKIDKLNDYKKSLIYEYVTGKREVL